MVGASAQASNTEKTAKLAVTQTWPSTCVVRTHARYRTRPRGNPLLSTRPTV